MKTLWRIIKEIISFIVTFAVIFAIFFAVRTYVLEPFQVKGHSMDYTLADGERVLMTKIQKLERFDIVIVQAPDDPGKLYVKRVIGMPGDAIEYKAGTLYINGQATKEPYLEQKEAETQGAFTEDFSLQALTGSQIVPAGKIFLMGDNRQNSLDGRSFGFIDENSVKGEASAIYWPFEKAGLLDKYELSAQGIVEE